jgi:hypothetical protein
MNLALVPLGQDVLTELRVRGCQICDLGPQLITLNQESPDRALEPENPDCEYDYSNNQNADRKTYHYYSFVIVSFVC